MAKALESAVLLGCYLPTFCLVLEGVNPPPWSKQFSIFFCFVVVSQVPSLVPHGAAAAAMGSCELRDGMMEVGGSLMLPRSVPRHDTTQLGCGL